MSRFEYSDTRERTWDPPFLGFNRGQLRLEPSRLLGQVVCNQLWIIARKAKVKAFVLIQFAIGILPSPPLLLLPITFRCSVSSLLSFGRILDLRRSRL